MGKEVPIHSAFLGWQLGGIKVRHLIYTTNAVEGYHRMVRKYTKSKSIFPTDDLIRKVVYLSVKEIQKKWTMPARNWAMAYSQIMICFADRLAA